MDDTENQEGELRSPFPSPPSHYTKYTTNNLRLLSLLNSRVAELGDESQHDQHDILSDQEGVPDWPLTQLEKPRVDWILEEGQYTVFGDTWFVKETIPSLGELGGHQLYPSDPTIDRRPALVSILRTLLATYSSLLGSLLAPPPTASNTEPPEWQKHMNWMTIMTQNIMGAANDLRPVQARYNLENMMKTQLDNRKRETVFIHERCDALEKRFSELKGFIESQRKGSMIEGDNKINEFAGQRAGDWTSKKLKSEQLIWEDVFRWAEEA